MLRPRLYSPSGPFTQKKFGDGRWAFLALESNYRREGIYRMQQLQSKLTNLAVTADDHFDPARVIQELRRISAELDALGDKVVPCLLYTSPSPRDKRQSRMPSSA